MAEFLKKEWVKIFVNCILSALIFLLGFWLTSSKANSFEINKKIELLTTEKASIPYVDKQDLKLSKDLDAHKIDDKNKDDMQLELIRSMDKKIDILLLKK